MSTVLDPHQVVAVKELETADLSMIEAYAKELDGKKDELTKYYSDCILTGMTDEKLEETGRGLYKYAESQAGMSFTLGSTAITKEKAIDRARSFYMELAADAVQEIENAKRAVLLNARLADERLHEDKKHASLSADPDQKQVFEDDAAFQQSVLDKSYRDLKNLAVATKSVTKVTMQDALKMRSAAKALLKMAKKTHDNAAILAAKQAVEHANLCIVGLCGNWTLDKVNKTGEKKVTAAIGTFFTAWTEHTICAALGVATLSELAIPAAAVTGITAGAKFLVDKLIVPKIQKWEKKKLLEHPDNPAVKILLTDNNEITAESIDAAQRYANADFALAKQELICATAKLVERGIPVEKVEEKIPENLLTDLDRDEEEKTLELPEEQER